MAIAQTIRPPMEAYGETIVDIVREFRALGVNNARPTIPATLCSAALWRPDAARWPPGIGRSGKMCQDVLNADCIKVTREGQPVVGLERLDEIIEKVLSAHAQACHDRRGIRRKGAAGRPSQPEACEGGSETRSIATWDRNAGVPRISIRWPVSWTAGAGPEARTEPCWSCPCWKLEKVRLTREMQRAEQRCADIRKWLDEIDAKQHRLHRFAEQPHGRRKRPKRARSPRRFRIHSAPTDKLEATTVVLLKKPIACGE